MVALLERAVWGTTGPRYVTHDQGKLLDRIAEPRFFSLMEGGELVAVSAHARKTVRLCDNTYDAFFSIAIAVEAAKIGQGYGALLHEHSCHHLFRELGERSLIYAYVEVDNERSLRMCKKAGYVSIGSYNSIICSRLRPKDDARVDRLESIESKTLVQLLNDQYADHALLDFEQSVAADDYYVLKQAGRIVAGVQADRLHWTIKHLPGLSGMMLMKVLPCFPFLRRRFDARDYHFLRLGNVYARMGYEAEVFTLIEALLARQGVYTAMVVMDERSPAYQRIAQAGRFGIMGTGATVAAHVVASFNDVSEEEIEEIQRRPLHISAMDIL
jgi:hypothetical protein